MKKWALPLLSAGMLASVTAHAYPTAIVFTPTGETKNGGNVGVLAYASTNLSPSITPGATWFGAQIGVLPQFDYGSSGLKFGGLEVGFDTISPYGRGIVKPVLNAKLGLVTEGSWSPSVSAGLMQVSPALQSMNYTYVSATKTLVFSRTGPSFGRLTFGLGYNAGHRAQFNGTFPFNDTRFALMAGYESPMIAKRVGFMVDHLGGGSEISSTYAGTSLALSDTTALAAGVYLANDRRVADATYDGFFGYVTTSFDALKL